MGDTIEFELEEEAKIFPKYYVVSLLYKTKKGEKRGVKRGAYRTKSMRKEEEEEVVKTWRAYMSFSNGGFDLFLAEEALLTQMRKQDENILEVEVTSFSEIPYATYLQKITDEERRIQEEL